MCVFILSSMLVSQFVDDGFVGKAKDSSARSSFEEYGDDARVFDGFNHRDPPVLDEEHERRFDVQVEVGIESHLL